MKVFSDCDQPELRGCALTIGNFDGVHRGHLALLRRLREAADRDGVPAVVMTFEPHPAAVLSHRGAPPPLVWPERRTELLAEAGIDAVIVLAGTPALFQTSAEHFFHHLLRKQLAIRAIVEGPNFRFGRNREGDVRLLTGWCNKYGIRLEIVPPVEFEGRPISSTRIRDAIRAGLIDQANAMLSRPFATRGTVVHGAGRGAALGYPTANLQDLKTVIPAPGIYAGLARIDGRSYAAAISLGGNPTFGEEQVKFEVYVCDFSGNLYGRELEVLFLQRLRDVVRFDGVEALLDRMALDVAIAKEKAAEYLKDAQPDRHPPDDPSRPSEPSLPTEPPKLSVAPKSS
ncbi:MAG: bifunctional riboflavin kinase/FAD synthetase [Thermogutta sp.]